MAGESASKRASFTSLLCVVLHSIKSFLLSIRSILFFFSLFIFNFFFLLLNFVSLYFIYLISFFFFLLLIRSKALDTEAYQVGLWAGEGDHGAVKSPRTYCRRRLLNTRCVGGPIARVRARFSTTTTRARGNNIENRTLEIFIFFLYFFNFFFFFTNFAFHGRKSSLDTGCFSETCRFFVFFYYIIYFVVRYLPPTMIRFEFEDSIRSIK